ncbi:MAG: 2-succinyl-5-enolpyruvyl-6-hydroxy-3-cyclohexene-1-carboxylic-acid synthase, partial [Myxococcota bacterium]
MSPGSRSTPIVLAAERSGIPFEVCIDERSAAFQALGAARATESAAVLVCTSGSAAAHYLPAVMEANATGARLLMITADRPAHVRGSGANQTADQRELFGRHARFLDLGAPSKAAAAGTFSQLRRAVHEAGPLQINAEASKPLEGRGEPFDLPQSRTIKARRIASEDALDALAETLARGQRPLMVAGPAPLSARTYAKDAQRVAECLGAPVMADWTSQLLGLPFLPILEADAVLQIGRAPVASEWLAWAPGRRRVILTQDAPVDPTFDADLIVEGDIGDALHRLADGLTERPPWAAERSERLAEAIASVEARDLGHASVARIFSEAMPRKSVMMAGNSLAVRHLDLFASRRSLPVLHQRGLSGIDGLIA